MLGSQTKFFVKTGVSTYTQVPNVTSVEGPDRSRPAVENSDLDDTYATYEAGQPTLGECTVTINYVTFTEFDTLADIFAAGPGEFRKVRADGSKLDFNGVSLGLAEGTAERNGLYTTTLTIQGDGAPTDAATV